MTEELENPQDGIEEKTTTETSSMSTNGGKSFDTTAENQDANPSPTGSLDSDIYAVSALPTSGG